ncbi:hypothetical protein [Streptomyces sp. NPDC001500]
MSATGVPLSRGRPWQLAVTAAVAVTAVWVLAAHRHTVDAGADRLAGAGRAWLLTACAAALATRVCAAVAQQGAVAERLPDGRLVAAQSAACAANRVLPAGVGASAAVCGSSPAVVCPPSAWRPRSRSTGAAPYASRPALSGKQSPSM